MHDDTVDLGRARVDDATRGLSRDEVGEVPEGVGDTVDVDAALLHGLARVPALQQTELFAVAYEEIGDAAQQCGALGDGGVGPVALVECSARGLDREVGVLLVTLRDQDERPGVRGVEDLARGTGGGFAPLAVHVDGLPRLEFCCVRHDRDCLPFLFSAAESHECHSSRP